MNDGVYEEELMSRKDVRVGVASGPTTILNTSRVLEARNQHKDNDPDDSSDKADVASLAFTAPLFASILAVVFLKEIIGIKRIIAIILGFIGAIIVIDPVYSSINNGHILTLLSASVWSVSSTTILKVEASGFSVSKLNSGSGTAATGPFWSS